MPNRTSASKNDGQPGPARQSPGRSVASPEDRKKAAMYLRKSTTDGRQNVRVQEQPLREWVGRLGYEPVLYSEPGISGAATSRPILDDMMKAVRRRELAAVCVLRLDRLGRSLAHLLQLLSEFESNGVRLLIHDMALDTATPHGKLFFSIIGGMAEYERALSRTGQRWYRLRQGARNEVGTTDWPAATRSGLRDNL